MLSPSRAAVTPLALLTTALLTTLAAAAPADAGAQRPARQPEGTIVVFVTEGAQIAWAGTRLREYAPSTGCQAFPPGAHVVANHTDQRLLFYSDPLCLFPVPPPFNFIAPGYGAHVSPSGGFKSG